MKLELADVILRPLLTEKSMGHAEALNQVSFEVHPAANKILIRHAVERLFDVKVTDVRVINMRGKAKRFGARMGRRKDWKKALVHLAEGYSLDVFEGVPEGEE
jgi:large subunit ribosomal protein L23